MGPCEAEIFNPYGGGVQVSATGAKQGRCSTWVKFRYHKYDEFKTLYKEQLYELTECHKYYKNGGKSRKHNQGNSNHKSKTETKKTKKMISLEVDSTISQLDRSDNKYYRKNNKNPAQASSTISNKKVRLNIILMKRQAGTKVPIIICDIYLLLIT